MIGKNLGKKRTPEQIENIRQANIGKITPEEVKEKQRQGNLGKKQSPEAIEKIRQSSIGRNCGKIQSLESKEKNRIAHLGKKKSSETKAKMRNVCIERYKDPNERRKISQANLHIFSALDHLCKDKYCPLFNNKLKQQVRERDGHICQLCGKTLFEEGKNLPVHHIHYDKKNCYPDLITLCNSCNAKANFNKNIWESLYMNKLNDRELLFWTKYRNKTKYIK